MTEYSLLLNETKRMNRLWEKTLYVVMAACASLALISAGAVIYKIWTINV